MVGNTTTDEYDNVEDAIEHLADHPLVVIQNTTTHTDHSEFTSVSINFKLRKEPRDTDEEDE